MLKTVPGEAVPSPRGKVMIINLLFSLMKIEKPGYYHVWHLERVRAEDILPAPCCLQGALRSVWSTEMEDLYQLPAWSQHFLVFWFFCFFSFLGFYWMFCSCQLPLPLLVSSVITATFLTFLLLLSLLFLSFLSPVIFWFLFLASWLCPNLFKVLPSFSLGNNSFPRF